MGCSRAAALIALALPCGTGTTAYEMEATFGVVEEASPAGLIVSMLPADAPGSLLAEDPTALAIQRRP